MDAIREGVSAKDDSYKTAEFDYFAREYPRHYRYFLDCAGYRLKAIAERYEHLHGHYANAIAKSSGNMASMAHSDHFVWQIYWDFDSFLQCLGSALDLAARICGPAFSRQMPITFNNFVRKADGPLAAVFVQARDTWVGRLKNYRDCIVHFTPISNMPGIGAHLYRNGWELRIGIPTNPSVREAEYFRYSRQAELLRYAIGTYRRWRAFDRKVARQLKRMYREGSFPRRLTGLFGV